MSSKLRELIRNVRAAKTAAEERAVIAKECALIRTAFRDEESPYRNRNISKLLFVHMLGYPSHFGRMECLKLIASPSFTDKRMGYLGLVILLDEDTDVLMLVTNSLKNDLNHANQYIVGLACSALGNIGSVEMVRGLTGELERMMQSSNPYISKKAALCAIRVGKKVPELVEDLVDKAPDMLRDKNHGVVISALHFMTACMEQQPEYVLTFRKQTSKLVKMLKNLVLSGYAPEYDVNGITDPFVQVALIKCLRLLGEGDDECSAKMGDILAQVATNTEGAKNAGNAILYETVRTIMRIESAGGHRVLAINILGKFLLNRDNNIRYVALLSLAKVVEKGDLANVVRHYETIVECLKDPDVSIRRRAMNLVYSLVNDDTVRQLGREMLSYLAMAEKNEYPEICQRMSDTIEKYAPNPRWHIDTLIAMFRLAGGDISEQTEAILAHLIADNNDLQSYSVHTLYKAVQDEMHQPALTRTAVWAIGELGELLLRPCSSEFSEAPSVTRSDITNILTKLMKTHSASVRSRCRILNACIKLVSGPFEGTQEVEELKKLLSMFSTSMELELQIRSCEYLAMNSTSWSHLSGDVLKRMPPINMEVIRDKQQKLETGRIEDDDFSSDSDSDSDDEDGSDSDSDDDNLKSSRQQKSKQKKRNKGKDTGRSSSSNTKENGAGTLLDMDDLLGIASSTIDTSSNISSSNSNDNGMGVLDDIFGSSSPMMAVSTSMPATSASTPSLAMNGGLDDLLGSMSLGTPSVPITTSSTTLTASMPAVPSSSTSQLPPLTVYNKNGLCIVFNLKKPIGAAAPPGALMIQCLFTNTGMSKISELVFQASVPKFIKIQMQSASGTALSPGSNDSITQLIKVQNTAVGTKKMMMRCKIDFKSDGNPITDKCNLDSFPSGL